MGQPALRLSSTKRSFTFSTSAAAQASSSGFAPNSWQATGASPGSVSISWRVGEEPWARPAALTISV